jgi:Flp pilus assembly protein TadG
MKMQRLSAWINGFVRDQRGAVSAEFVLVLPLLIVLTYGSISFLMLLSTTTAIHFAAEDGARCAAVRPAVCTNAGTTQTYAAAHYAGPALTGMTFTYTNPACGHRVAGSGAFILHTGLSDVSVPLSAIACYPDQS